MECPHCGKQYKRKRAFEKHIDTHAQLNREEQDRKLLEACEAFRRQPSKNPFTGRSIKVGGPLYKKIEQQCKGVVRDEEHKVSPPSAITPRIDPQFRVSRFKRIADKPSIKPFVFDPEPYFTSILSHSRISPSSRKTYKDTLLSEFNRLLPLVQQLHTHETMRTVYALALISIITKYEVDTSVTILDLIRRTALKHNLNVSNDQIVHAEVQLFQIIMTLYSKRN